MILFLIGIALGISAMSSSVFFIAKWYRWSIVTGSIAVLCLASGILILNTGLIY
jgi:hypothetical protein